MRRSLMHYLPVQTMGGRSRDYAEYVPFFVCFPALNFIFLN